MSADDPRSSASLAAQPPTERQLEHKRPRLFIHRPDRFSPEESDEARRNASAVDAAKLIEPASFANVHRMPCVRDAFLPGIGLGAGVGAARFVLGGSVMTACNWASGAFVGVSMIAFQLCQRRRRIAKEGMREAVKVLDKKEELRKEGEAKERMVEAKKGDTRNNGLDRAIGPPAVTLSGEGLEKLGRTLKKTFW